MKEKAPAKALSWLKAPTNAFTFKTQLNVKVLIGTFNLEKALSVIVKSSQTLV